MSAGLGVYIALVNLAAFGLMGWDKSCAERGVSRIPEKTLLTFALIGGAFGAIAAQRKFRHKTRKEPFRTLLLGAALFNIAAAIALSVPSVRETAFSALNQ